MERFNKKYILILLLVGIFLLTGCNKIKFDIFTPDEDSPAGVTVVPDNTGESTGVTDDNTSKDNSGSDVSPTVKAPLADIELPIYTINANGALEPVTALVPEGSEIVPELIVQKVVESLADQSITIGCDSVTTEKDAVIVSFKKDQAPFVNMGTEFEENILNAFAQSLIDNVTSIKKVIFRIEGNAYSSGAFEYGINEPYMQE